MVLKRWRFGPRRGSLTALTLRNWTGSCRSDRLSDLLIPGNCRSAFSQTGRLTDTSVRNSGQGSQHGSLPGRDGEFMKIGIVGGYVAFGAARFWTNKDVSCFSARA